MPLETTDPKLPCCISLHHFYDAHIGEGHLLKRIVVLDDLCEGFLGIAQDALDEVILRDLVQPRGPRGLKPSNMYHMKGAGGVADRYFCSVSSPACSLAAACTSMLHTPNGQVLFSL